MENLWHREQNNETENLSDMQRENSGKWGIHNIENNSVSLGISNIKNNLKNRESEVWGTKALKGTVSRDFYPCSFPSNVFPWATFSHPKVFPYICNFEFAEIFKFEIDSAVSTNDTTESKSFLNQPHMFRFCLKGLGQYNSSLLKFWFDLLFKETRAFTSFSN